MRASIQLLLISLIHFIISTKQLVKTQFDDWRVIGGVQANKGEFPHQVLIFRKDSIVCSGSLIEQQWIVTAAHCVTYNVGPKTIPEIKNKESLFVKVGEYNVEEIDSNKIDLNITEVIDFAFILTKVEDNFT